MLENCSPADVFYYFEQISSIPRGSGNSRQIADYIEAFAGDRGLYCERDAYDNVIIKKPGTALLEDAPAVMLQGHLDMVCEKMPESSHDFLSDPLPLETDGKYVWSRGTTLGADDGIAVAMMLAILHDASAVHPQLECVFTSDEEIGLIGAQNLDLSGCRARYLINLDCDEDGVFIAGCCGGVRVRYRIPLRRNHSSGRGRRLILHGLQGGHSGAEIHKNGGNAVRLMGRLLSAVDSGSFALVSVKGGDKDNVIPARCEAVILGDGDFSSAFAALQKEYQDREPDLQLTEEELGKVETDVLTDESQAHLLRFLTQAPCGVLSMHPDIEGLVGTSANLAAVETGEDCACGTVSVRSETGKQRDAVCAQISSLLASMDGSEQRDGAYPGWEYNGESQLRQTMVETWQKMFSEVPRVEVIHAGLECGVLQSKMPGLDIVSFGPAITGIHTPAECLDVASVEKNYRFLLEVLTKLGRNRNA